MCPISLVTLQIKSSLLAVFNNVSNSSQEKKSKLLTLQLLQADAMITWLCFFSKNSLLCL